MCTHFFAELGFLGNLVELNLGNKLGGGAVSVRQKTLSVLLSDKNVAPTDPISC